MQRPDHLTSMLRAACPGESAYIRAPEMVQLAMKLLSPRDTPHILDGVINATSGLRLRIDGDFLVSHRSPFEVVRLPKVIASAEDACNYLYLNHTPDFRQTLATVGVNEKIVAMNSHHLCADGGFLRYIYEHCADPAFPKRQAPPLPRALTDIWRAPLHGRTAAPPPDDPQALTRVSWRASPRDRHGNEKADFAQWNCPVSSLRVYNRKTGKCDGLTERLWIGLALAAHAYNRAISRNFGILTCVDLRHLMPKRELDIDVCNNFIGVSIVANGVTEKSTIKEIGEAMRRNFVEKERKAGGLFTLPPGTAEQAGSCVVCLSNMGALRIKEPFEDVWMQQTMDSHFANGSLCFLTWSKIAKGRNEFWGRLRYSPQVFSRPDADGLARSIAYVLEQVPEEATAESVIGDLIELQSSF
jgi:hypothetical protein